MEHFDLIIIGAGAAGLFCASVAGQRGARVALLDHSERLAEKIRISGGGRCNFTNLEADRPERFLSNDPRFARAALRAYGPRRFVDLVRRHGIAFHEKHRGQLFCDDSSGRIIDLLVDECAAGHVTMIRPQPVRAVSTAAGGPRYRVGTDVGEFAADRLVIATGGLSIPKIGATDFAHRIARQFGLPIVAPRPGLVPFVFEDAAWSDLGALSGLSLPVRMGLDDGESTQGGPAAAEGRRSPRFDEDLLFTHRGLSGPAALQISSYWQPGGALAIDLAAGADLEQPLINLKSSSRQSLAAALAGGALDSLPRRLVQAWLAASPFAGDASRRLAELPNRRLVELAQALRRWVVRPSGTEGYRKAEVTVGGVDTAALDPLSLQARAQPGLYFIGEAVDVTGWLGGYNFQWAWASAHAAAMSATSAMGATGATGGTGRTGGTGATGATGAAG